MIGWTASLQRARPWEAAGGHGAVTSVSVLATAVSAVLRSVAAAAASLVLCSGIALVLWAVTPAAGADATQALRGGALAFASAHLLPVTIGGTPVTLRPLLVTVLAIAVVATSAGRARPVVGRTLEAWHVSIFTVCYAVVVDVLVVLTTPAGDASAGLAGPSAVAAIGVLIALGCHPTAWRHWWRAVAPAWLRAGVRAAVATMTAMAALAALALAVSLIAGLGEAIDVIGLSTGSAAGAVGMVLLCLAFGPNAVVAAMGYLSGVGFSIGAAGFSPLTVHDGPLPAIPLLAAAPRHALGPAAWAVLAAFALAVLTVMLVATRSVTTRVGRLLAVGSAAVLAGMIMSGLAWVAGGGVAGGPWQSTGVPPLLSGGVVAAVVAVVGAAVAVSGGRRVPWRAVGVDDDAMPPGDQAAVPGDEEADRDDPAPADPVIPADDAPDS